MNHLFVLLLALTAFAKAFPVLQWEAPWFCHDLDCPKYTNPENKTIKGKNVEIRVYESALWSSTVIENTDLKDAENTGFMRNFNYIGGGNQRKEKIPMTSPVTNYVQPPAGPYCSTNFTVSFFVPYAYQPPKNLPPAPTDHTVFLETELKKTVAVLSFDGFADQQTVIAKAAELNGLLRVSGMKYDKENWYSAGYDPPFKVSGRHNEIWIEIFDATTPSQFQGYWLYPFQRMRAALWRS